MFSGAEIWIGGDLFLAFVPVALAFVIASGIRRDAHAFQNIRWGLWLPLLFVWLLFLPNTCYLLTEWRHYLLDIHDRERYYPIYAHGLYAPAATLSLLGLTTFYLIYTGLGLAAFCSALWPLDHLARRCWGRMVEPVRAIVCFLCSLGVYLGLVNRFNSWDLVNGSRFGSLVATTVQVFERPYLLVLILLFGASLRLLYAGFALGIDGVTWRLSHRNNKLDHDPLEKDTPHAFV